MYDGTGDRWDGVFGCDYGCGFKGEFDAVADHELGCTRAKFAAGTATAAALAESDTAGANGSNEAVDHDEPTDSSTPAAGAVPDTAAGADAREAGGAEPAWTAEGGLSARARAALGRLQKVEPEPNTVTIGMMAAAYGAPPAAIAHWFAFGDAGPPTLAPQTSGQSGSRASARAEG